MLEAQRKVAIQGAISYQNGLQMFRDGEKYRGWVRQNNVGFTIQQGVNFSAAIGGGGYTGPLLTIGGETSLSLNPNLQDLNGETLTIGSSASGLLIPLGAGLEYNYVYNSNTRDSITINYGGKALAMPYILPVEGHVILLNTKVYIKDDAFNDVNRAIRWLEDNINTRRRGK